MTLKRCNQCWREKPREDFIGPSGREREKNCNECTDRYRNWSKKTPAQKLDGRRPRFDPRLEGRVVFVAVSKNRKLGAIPVSYSERGTCPPACAFYEAGCYAEVGKDGAHWRSVPSRGLSWDQFLDKIRSLPVGQLWRHNEAGDLAGRGDVVDAFKLADLVVANMGRQGFTFTHKPITADSLDLLREANRHGFTINMSADSLTEADTKADFDLPVVCVTTSTGYSPAGRKLVPCPAQTHSMTCAECQLCVQSQRKAIITFAPHGQSAALIPELVRRKRTRDTAHA